MTNGLSYLAAKQKPDGNAIINTLQQLAGAIGTSVVSTIVAAAQSKTTETLASATETGSRHAFFLLAIFSLLMLCCSLFVFLLSRKNQPIQKVPLTD